jgi:peptidyl-prolyl cis-trans isomerase SurA
VKPVTFLVLLTGLALATGCSSNTSASADVVARVNSKDITTSQLDKQFLARTSGAEQPPAPEEFDEIKLQLLNQMINDEILLEMASQAGLNATDGEVDVKFNDFKGQYTTEEQFQEALKQQKMTVDDIKAELKKSLTIEKLVNKEITSKITVTDAEIKALYEKNKQSFNLPEGYHIAHILVTPAADPEIRNTKNDDAKTPEEAQQKANRILKEIQGGRDFAVEAREYSEDPASAPAGGDLDFLPLEAISNVDPRLAQAVQRLKVGETSPQVIETRLGFHILKLLDRDKGGQKELTDARVQTQLRKAIFNRKDQTLKAAFSEAARNKAQVRNFLAERILANAGKS